MKANKEIFMHLRVAGITTLLVAMVGCSSVSKDLTDEEIQQRISSDISAIYQGQQKVLGAITIGEAVVRALKYNMDHRLKQMEAAVALGQYNLNRLDMLPQVVAQAGYSERDNDPGARSINLETGEESLPPSSSAERESDTSDISFVWNLLDFGLSYYTAKQGKDKIRIAEQRRRKTVQNITEDVVDSFWKALISQNLAPKVEELLAETREALVESKKLVANGTQSAVDGYRVQADMLVSINTLLEIRERISLSRVRLAALLNISPGTEYKLLSLTDLDYPVQIGQNVDELVNMALSSRPELREEDYQKRISQLEVKKSFLKLFPNLSFNIGKYRDDNQFLVNNSWERVGRNISWDLFGILNASAEKKLNQANVDLADVRRQALSKAIITQVYLSMSRYELARSRYLAANELYAVRKGLADHSAASKGVRVSGIDELETRSSAIASELRRSLAYAETQTALARVMNSVGVDPVPATAKSGDVFSMAYAFDNHFELMASGMFAQNDYLLTKSN